MKLSNSQVKTLIQVYEMIDNARQKKIPVTDISNDLIIKRFEKVLNNIIYERIADNQDTINYLYHKANNLYQKGVK